ncbi:hypothetical protein HYPGJ_20031 [Hyphomicrobium sp. GJ21]|nr:hypothetical protein HYPGJ_20031 [Hyphomicrobium sp. GJ21]
MCRAGCGRGARTRDFQATVGRENAQQTLGFFASGARVRATLALELKTQLRLIAWPQFRARPSRKKSTPHIARGETTTKDRPG